MKKIMILCILFTVSCSVNQDIEQISYEEFKKEILSDKISKVTYKGDLETILAQRYDGSILESYQPLYILDSDLDQAIQKNGVEVIYESVEQPSLLRKLSPLTLTIILFILLIMLPLAIWAAYLASNRNQSRALWFFLTLLFPIAIIFIASKDVVKKN